MLTLGQAARIGTVPATGPAIRHASPDATDAELRYWASRAESVRGLIPRPDKLRARLGLGTLGQRSPGCGRPKSIGEPAEDGRDQRYRQPFSPTSLS